MIRFETVSLAKTKMVGYKPRCPNMITNHAMNGLSCRMQAKTIDAENRFALRAGQQHSSLFV